MTRLNSYIDKLTRDSARRPNLVEALVGNRFWRYALYRVRYLLARLGTRTALNFFELTLFYVLISPYYFGFVLIARSACALVGSAVWGGLEPLRAEVRLSYAARERPRVAQLVRSWLVVSVIIATSGLLAVSAWVAVVSQQRGVMSVFDAYVLASAVRIALDLVSRTYHAGVYAVRRVYRPLWSVILVDVLDVAAPLALWPVLGPWAFACSMILNAALSTAITVSYAHATYVLLRIPPFLRAPGGHRPDTGGWRQVVPVIASALASVTIDIDSILVLGLVTQAPLGDDGVAIAAFVHAVRPMLSAGHSWARLFYFDFKALERSYATVLRRCFENRLRRGAIVLAGTMWGLAFTWSLALFGDALVWVQVLFAPFFLLRSLVSLKQTQAFSYGRYRLLAPGGLLLVVGLVTLRVWGTSGLMILGIAIALMLALFATLPQRLLVTRALHTSAARFASPGRWSATLVREVLDTRVVLVRTSVRPVRLMSSRISIALADRLGATRVSMLSVGRIAYYERSDDAPLTNRDIVVLCAGLVDDIERGPWRASGREALLAMLGDGMHAPSASHVDHLRLTFRSRFPDGIVIDEFAQGAARLGSLSSLEILALGAALRHVSAGGVSRGRGPFDVTAFAPNGEPSLVFLVPRGEDPTTRRQWREEVERASLAATLAMGPQP